MIPKVVIFMATYNGEEFLKKQLNSIIDQTYTNWELYIRDDGSKDQTKKIISDYEKMDSRINMISDEIGNVGQCLNFKILLENSDSGDYYMFSDQDDIWLPFKIELTLKKMLELSEDTPTLVYTNYFNQINSTKKIELCYRKNMEKLNVPENILIQNWIMGCTMMMNRRLKEISSDIPIEAENHDNWIAIIASLCGKISYVGEPTMIHIIHTRNVTGREDSKKLINRLKRVKSKVSQKDKIISDRKILSTYIYEVVKSYGHKQGKKTFFDYQNILMTTGWKSLPKAYNNKFTAFNKTQTILFYLSIL